MWSAQSPRASQTDYCERKRGAHLEQEGRGARGRGNLRNGGERTGRMNEDKGMQGRKEEKYGGGGQMFFCQRGMQGCIRDLNR